MDDYNVYETEELWFKFANSYLVSAGGRTLSMATAEEKAARVAAVADEMVREYIARFPLKVAKRQAAQAGQGG